MTRLSDRHIKPARLALAAAALIALVVMLSDLNPSQADAWPSVQPVSVRANIPRPAIKQHHIPFGKKRKHEMAAYSKRHYGKSEWRLTNPKVIVIHYAVVATLSGIFNTFRTDQPDAELGELPNVCSHFAVDGKGRIQQFVPLSIRCRHTVGLNDRSIGIEHTGFSDHQVLSDKDQMHSSIKLTKWLRCKYDISIKNVIGHNESLSSPFHHEKVKRLRRQTHGDFKHKSMQKYRKQLRAAGQC
ncbi:MAG: N-acetylmuramoyl-L-alanine amidase [Thermoleophilia bacterium]|nr:N-acetylmuramoyl-L-alanine amidase [Thermoleophilia bacterium]